MRAILITCLFLLAYSCSSESPEQKEGSEYEHMSLLEEEQEEWSSNPIVSLGDEALPAPQEKVLSEQDILANPL
jgi:hypothetical protein